MSEEVQLAKQVLQKQPEYKEEKVKKDVRAQMRYDKENNRQDIEDKFEIYVKKSKKRPKREVHVIEEKTYKKKKRSSDCYSCSTLISDIIMNNCKLREGTCCPECTRQVTEKSIIKFYKKKHDQLVDLKKISIESSINSNISHRLKTSSIGEHSYTTPNKEDRGRKSNRNWKLFQETAGRKGEYGVVY